eukprot:TRINITY_DN841_c0_g1_i1.p1 TRINITY_DN841_c0_g1~~TRINITY_DN841_c0_g1_i1.p1  ORF type:complete len:268 (-),score=46.86 TRINITY_DN841_c0_g1_i1:44-847(-)
MSRYSIRRLVAIASSVCVWVAALLSVLSSFGAIGHRADVDYLKVQELDPTALRAMWLNRRDQLQIDIWTNLFYCIGLFGMAYCLLCLKRVFKRMSGHSDLPAFMTGCFFVGAVLPTLQLLQMMGTLMAANWMTSTPNFPDVGFQALHVGYMLRMGAGLFFVSSQFLFVSIGIAISSHLSFKTGELSAHHARLGVVIAVVGLLAFVFEVAAFAFYGPLGIVFGILAILWGIILVPAWLIWLGVLLVGLKEDQQSASRNRMDESLTNNL